MTTHKIRFNKKYKIAFIDNRNKSCVKYNDLFIDVFRCFKCENFLGLLFTKRGLKIHCNDGLDFVYGKAVFYVPKDFDELLELQKVTIQSKDEALNHILNEKREMLRIAI